MLKIITNPFPDLNTNRLVLRRLAPSDLEELIALRSNEQVNRYLNRPPATPESAKAFIQKIDELIETGKGFYWVIALKDDLKLIGTICYWNLQAEQGSTEIGYELLPDYQGLGLMSEAIAETTRYGMDEIGLKIIAALTHPDNEASIKLLKQNGFILDEINEIVSKEDADGLAVFVLLK